MNAVHGITNTVPHCILAGIVQKILEQTLIITIGARIKKGLTKWECL